MVLPKNLKKPSEPAGPSTSLNSVAILGLLAVAPMTAYTLAEQVARRALPNIWSVSRRLIMAEPKRLADRGLVEPIQAEAGSRAGQRWAATPAGRRELKRWLRTPVAPTEIRSDMGLRLVFADHGEVGDLRRSVEQRLEQLRDDLRLGSSMAADYLATGGPFPDRLHITTATIRFIGDQKLAELRSLEWLLAEIDHWSDTRTASPRRHHQVLHEAFRRMTDALNEQPGGAGPP